MRLEVAYTFPYVLLYPRRYRNGKRILSPHIGLVYMLGARELGGNRHEVQVVIIVYVNAEADVVHDPI